MDIDDALSNPWVWVVAGVVVVLALARRGGGGYEATVATNEIAARTSVQLSEIQVRALETANALRQRSLELDFARDDGDRTLVQSIIDGMQRLKLQAAQTERDLGLARISASVENKRTTTAALIDNRRNATEVKLARIKGANDFKVASLAIPIARINAKTQIVTTQRLAARDERQAAYEYRAAKYGAKMAATADIVGSVLDFGGNFI